MLTSIALVIGVVKYKEEIIYHLFIKKDHAEVVMFGDSLTSRGNWEELLGKTDINNSGLSGFHTLELKNALGRWVFRLNPKICFIEGGINDFEIGISLERTKENYKAILDTLIAHRITPVVQSTLYQENNPVNRVKVDSLNQFLLSYCQKNNIEFLDINSKLSTKDGLKPEYSTDGTHINEAAYHIWAKEVSNTLKDLESAKRN